MGRHKRTITVYFPPDVWEMLRQALAERRGESRNRLITEAVRAYLSDPRDSDRQLLEEISRKLSEIIRKLANGKNGEAIAELADMRVRVLRGGPVEEL